MPNLYWTREIILSEMRRYSCMKELQDNAPKAYCAALRQEKKEPGFIRKNSGYKIREYRKWTRETLIKEMRKYSSINEFKTKSSGAWATAHKQEKIEPGFIKENCGYKTFKLKWTRENIIAEMKKYSCLQDFLKNSRGAAHAAYKQERIEPGFIKKYSKYKIEARKFWSQKEILIEIKKYKTRRDFKQKNPSAFASAYRLVKQKDPLVFKAFHGLKRFSNKYELSYLIKTAKKYKTKVDLIRENKGVYYAILSNAKKDPKFLVKAFKHMVRAERPMKWTKNDIIKESKKYKQRSHFQKQSKGAYAAARKIDKIYPGFMDKVCSHMVHPERPRKWTKDNVRNEAVKYNKRIDFIKRSPNAYYAAKRISKSKPGFMDRICSHMTCDITFREKKAQAKFNKQIEKHLRNIGDVYREFKIPIRDNEGGRVDFFIRTKDFCFAIEYKHDDSIWWEKEINRQIRKYNRAFRERKGFLGTLVVSPKGKYGISEAEFFTGYLPLIHLAIKNP